MSEAKRLAFFLPNTFTALNLGCGFVSILFAWKQQYYAACMILMLGAIFDSVDGRVARLTGTQSPFGEQFDSMSDIVTFGVAPAMLVYNRFFIDYGRVGMVISFLFVLCGALRLARFNANIEKVNPNFFQGLPIPGAAVAVVGYILLSLDFEILNQLPIVAGIYVAFYAILMITNIQFYSFKSSPWLRNKKKLVLVIIFLLLASIFIYEEIMICAIITVYVLGSMIYFFASRTKMQEIFQWKGDRENDDEK